MDSPAPLGVFVRDMSPLYVTTFCEPGVGNTRTCACGNPPSGPARGCDNSSSTGGAALSATGISYLAQDHLIFTTSGQKPSALTVVMQGTSSIHAGLAFGQGVRCVGGLLKRLYTKAATNGGIVVPDYHNQLELAVSWRSQQLGDTILSGQTRYYFAVYRDPVVLGGCPATSTFNSTQAAAIVWYQ
jgi:hypothetical protein